MKSASAIRIGLLGALALAAAGCIHVNLPTLRPQPFEERVVLGESGPKILLLDVDGTLSESGEAGTFGLGGRASIVSRVRQQLDLAREDPEVRALIVRIHSPGGTATASEILYEELVRFKEATEVPVVAQLMGVAASGGYYVAMAADRVRAYPTTVTGSIGVIFAGVNLSGLMQKVGVADQTLTSGPFKDAGSPLRPMTDAERAQLQSVLDDLFGRFLEVVERGRPSLSRERIEALADGRIYSAEQALAEGLVDVVGDLPGAVDDARQSAGLDEARVIVYQRPGELRENLFSPRGQIRAPGATSWLPGGAGEPGFWYLWWPGGP